MKIRNEFNSLNCEVPRAEFLLLTKVTNSRSSMCLLGTFVTKMKIKVKKKMPISVSSLPGSIRYPHKCNKIRQTNLDFNFITVSTSIANSNNRNDRASGNVPECRESLFHRQLQSVSCLFMFILVRYLSSTYFLFFRLWEIASVLAVEWWPLLPEICLGTFFIIKPTRCANIPNLIRHETLHVSGSSSAHHQEFIHCIFGTGICHTGLKTAF